MFDFYLVKACAILAGMDWRERLQNAGLDGLAGVLLEVLEPFSILGAQLLWVAQPTLALFMDQEKISGWAAFLEDPQHLAHLRESLTKDETNE